MTHHEAHKPLPLENRALSDRRKEREWFHRVSPYGASKAYLGVGVKEKKWDARFRRLENRTLFAGESLPPCQFFLRCWEHEALVLFLEPVGEIEEFGLLGDEGGLPIGGLLKTETS